MAYEPKEWACGDIISADGLNNLETGVQEALACCDSGGGTSLVTKTYEMRQVTLDANKASGSSANFSEPIALSKIRAMWVEISDLVFATLANFGGNLSADQVYQIAYNLVFIPGETDTRTQVTVTPTLYITMEE